MSEATNFNDYLKGLSPVTSLAATDRLVACDSNGNLKEITRENAINQGSVMTYQLPAGEERWVRIAKMSKYGAFCMIAVGVTGFDSGKRWHIPLAFSVGVGHASGPNIYQVKALSSCPFTNVPSNSFRVFKKMRITGNEATAYIDILVDSTTYTRNLEVRMSNAIAFELLTPIENPVLSQSSKEFELTDIFGGG